MLAWLCVVAASALAGAAPACVPRAGLACLARSGATGETEFHILNESMLISHEAGEALTVKCQGASLADLSVLPAFRDEVVVVRALRLHACPLPRAPLHDVLRALNATLLCALSAARPCELQLRELPPEPALSADHFRGLESLESLDVQAASRRGARPEPAFLAPLLQLRRLALRHVTLEERVLGAPPPTLRHLDLTYTGLHRLPPAWLAAPLEVLSVDSEEALDVPSVPHSVSNLTLLSPATNVSLEVAPALLTLHVDSWTERTPQPLSSCPELRVLGLTRPALRVLPARWLQRCKRLERLELDEATWLLALPPELLVGAASLRTLMLRGGALRELPVASSGAQLLHPVHALQELDLSYNRLHALPSGTFSTARELRRLVLSHNNLTSGVLPTLQPLELLEELDLSYNSELRDFCSSHIGTSPLHEARGLRRLILAGTGASLVCHDWCHSMPRLERLDLQRTRVSELWFQDVRCERQVKNARVILRGTNVTLLYTTAAEYESAGIVSGANLARVELDSKLSCDCDMYWTRRALPALQHVRGLRCAGRALRDVPEGDMQCAAPLECAAFPALPAACTCTARPARDPRVRELVVTLHCESANRTRVPEPRARTSRRYRLLLAHNNITELTAADLYDEIEELDLRYNELRHVAAPAAARLARLPGALLLAHNPLDCSCYAAPLLRALHARPAELAGLQCAGGAPLEETAVAECPPPATQAPAWRVAAALAVLLALALVVLAALASRERRFFLKVVLLRLGLLWRPAEPAEEEARTYDAFVTFSHEDEAVALQLVERLEPAYRLCVHYRDWTPGRLIAEQVVESVQRSRRTLALVSRHFLASAWACAEFRSAQDAALQDARHRLVVVLLEPAELLPQDARLHAYLATNTYVRWQDPWLWDKLRVALPPPRAPCPPPRVSRHTPSTPCTPSEPSVFLTRAHPDPEVSPTCAPAESIVYPTCTPAEPIVSPTCASAEPIVSPTCAPADPIVSSTFAPPESIVSLTCAPAESIVSPTCAPAESIVSPTCAPAESIVSPTCAPAESIVSPTCAPAESIVSPTCAPAESIVSPTCAPPEPGVHLTFTPPEADSIVPSVLEANIIVPNNSHTRASLRSEAGAPLSDPSERGAPSPRPSLPGEQTAHSPSARVSESVLLSMPTMLASWPTPSPSPSPRGRGPRWQGACPPGPRALALPT